MIPFTIFCREITHKSQNGFVPGRNFLNNIVDIDAAGRIYSTKYQGWISSHPGYENHNLVKDIPVIAPFDFSAAFPSIIQAWVWLVLQHRKLPASFLTLFKALYENARAIFNHDGNEYVVLSFLSGVLQGRPASGMLFNSALDPFLLAFCTVLGNGTKGILRGCADDIGFALSRLSHLNLLHPMHTIMLCSVIIIFMGLQHSARS